MAESLGMEKLIEEIDKYLPYIAGIILLFVFLIVVGEDEDLGLFFLGIVVLFVVLEYFRNKRFNRIEELLGEKTTTKSTKKSASKSTSKTSAKKTTAKKSSKKEEVSN